MRELFAMQWPAIASVQLQRKACIRASIQFIRTIDPHRISLPAAQECCAETVLDTWLAVTIKLLHMRPLPRGTTGAFAKSIESVTHSVGSCQQSQLRMGAREWQHICTFAKVFRIAVAIRRR